MMPKTAKPAQTKRRPTHKTVRKVPILPRKPRSGNLFKKQGKTNHQKISNNINPSRNGRNHSNGMENQVVSQKSLSQKSRKKSFKSSIAKKKIVYSTTASATCSDEPFREEEDDATADSNSKRTFFGLPRLRRAGGRRHREPFGKPSSRTVLTGKSCR